MSRFHLRLVLLFTLAIALLAWGYVTVRTWAWDDPEEQNGSNTVVRIEPASTSIGQSAAFTVTVSIQGAQDLGAFQFNLDSTEKRCCESHNSAVYGKMGEKQSSGLSRRSSDHVSKKRATP